MPETMLIKDGDKYGGKYVATRSFKDKTVLCAGTNPVEVVKEAKKMGAKDPVLLYIPKKGMIHIYPVRNNAPLLCSGVGFYNNSGGV